MSDCICNNETARCDMNKPPYCSNNSSHIGLTGVRTYFFSHSLTPYPPQIIHYEHLLLNPAHIDITIDKTIANIINSLYFLILMFNNSACSSL